MLEDSRECLNPILLHSQQLENEMHESLGSHLEKNSTEKITFSSLTNSSHVEPVTFTNENVVLNGAALSLNNKWKGKYEFVFI